MELSSVQIEIKLILCINEQLRHFIQKEFFNVNISKCQKIYCLYSKDSVEIYYLPFDRTSSTYGSETLLYSLASSLERFKAVTYCVLDNDKGIGICCREISPPLGSMRGGFDIYNELRELLLIAEYCSSSNKFHLVSPSYTINRNKNQSKIIKYE